MQFVCYLALNWVLTPFEIFVFAVTSNVAGGAAGPLMESVSTRLAERFGFDYGHVRRWNSITFAVSNVVSGLAISRWGMVVLGALADRVAGADLRGDLLCCRRRRPDSPQDNCAFGFAATLAEARELIGSGVFLLFLLAASFDQGSHAFYYGYGGLHWRALGYSGAVIGAIWPLGDRCRSGAVFGFAARLPLARRDTASDAGRHWAASCAGRSWPSIRRSPSSSSRSSCTARPLRWRIWARCISSSRPCRRDLSATAQSLYAVGSNGIVMGLATFASGPLYATYGGRTYLLMSAMGVVAMVFADLARPCLARRTHHRRRRGRDQRLDLAARMRLFVHVHELLGVDLGVGLRRGQRGVAEQFLHAAQIAAVRRADASRRNGAAHAAWRDPTGRARRAASASGVAPRARSSACRGATGTAANPWRR